MKRCRKAGSTRSIPESHSSATLSNLRPYDTNFLTTTPYRRAMLLLSCTNLSRGYDATPLFEDVRSRSTPASASASSGPTAPARPPCSDPRRARRARRRQGATPRRRAARHCCSRSPSSPAGRTLFEEAKSALDELLAAQDDLIHTAEALAALHRRGRAQAPRRAVRPAHRTAAPPRRLQRRSQGRGRARRPRLRAGRLHRAGRHLLRRPAEPADARQAAALRPGRHAPRRAEQPPRHRHHALAGGLPRPAARGAC